MGAGTTARLVMRIATPGRAALLLAVGAAGGAAAIAVADVPDAGSVIHACVRLATPGQTVPLTTVANLTVIDTDAGQTCSSPTDPKVPETELTWNTAGAPGPVGPPGPPGANGTNGTNGAPGQNGTNGAPGTANTTTITLPPITGKSTSFGNATLSINGQSLTFGILGLNTLGKGSSGNGSGAGPVSAHEFVVNKLTDQASPKLLEAASTGTHIAKVTVDLRTPRIPNVPIHVRNAGKVYLQYTLTNVTITSIQSGGGGGNAPQENVSLSYTMLKAKFTYVPQKRS